MKLVKISIVALSMGLFLASCGGNSEATAPAADTTVTTTVTEETVTTPAVDTTTTTTTVDTTVTPAAPATH